MKLNIGNNSFMARSFEHSGEQSYQKPSLINVYTAKFSW